MTATKVELGRGLSPRSCAVTLTRSALKRREFSGAFPGYADNREPMLKVIRKHRDAAYKIDDPMLRKSWSRPRAQDWDLALNLGEKYGYRNSQVTVLAPTGTIGLLMDCDTTGVEPDFALVKFKKLAGGGYFKIVNHSVPAALKNLGYSETQIQDIIDYLLGVMHLEGHSSCESRVS